ncbi:DNA helicase PcrA [Oenococcus sicerae]|uniref:DNA helicase PcrA n=1 Tax=Oenococcus sicerae TaxID=2203724 RepID=UPI0010BC5EC4|nr:ATP-dependent DNA helicase PcrA [Oenococcus sicerae]
MKDLLAGLNDKQKEAVLTTEGPLLIMAGAGSGKTRVLTHRVAYLVQQKHIDPWSILAITFTNKAAREMKERIARLVDQKDARAIWVSTFHALSARVLRRDVDKIGFTTSFSILDGSGQKTLMKHVLNDLNYDSNQYDPKSILAAVSNFKNALQTPHDARDAAKTTFDEAVAESYDLYQRRLEQSQSMDFDDLIMRTIQLFKQAPDVLHYYQRKFKYIHVDEYQDTNAAQYKLVAMLAAGDFGSQNLAVVGDSDQSIYGWRGADMNNILNFEKDFPGAKTVVLEQNYRSTKNILTAANQVIQNNIERKPKNLWTENQAGNLIHYYRAQSESDEAHYVLTKIQDGVKAGRSLNDFAILFRTNAQSRVFEQIFSANRIQYTIVGGTRFFERKEIQDIVAYLQLAANLDNDTAFERIVNEPKRAIGNSSLEKLRAFAVKNNLSLMQAIAVLDDESQLSSKAQKNFRQFAQMVHDFKDQSHFLPVTELTNEIFTKTGIHEQYVKKNDLESQARVENLDEFLSQTHQFDEDYDEEASETKNALVDFLGQTALVSDLDSYDEAAGQVTLMTVHAAKGLEFPVVFIVGLEEGIFPSARAMMERDGLEEERRLAYVAITRAQQELYLTNAYGRLLYGRAQSNEPSMFIDEINDALLDKENAAAAGVRNVSGDYDRPMPFDRQPVSASRKHEAAFAPTYQGTGAEKTDWQLGDRVKHKIFGTGRIVAINNDGEDKLLKIAFASRGIKQLMASFAPIEKI